MNIFGYPLQEIFVVIFIIWLIVMIVYYSRIIILQIIKGTQRKNYKIGMFQKDCLNSTLQHVEENSTIDLIMGYYRKPLYYVEVVEKDRVQILKASEGERTELQTENLLRQLLRSGARLKVMTSKDKLFQVTIFHEKKYWGYNQ